MNRVETKSSQAPKTSFDNIARRIGRQLRDLYPQPEAEAIPVEHAQMLLELRHKERNTTRRG
ncbi:MAG TPA: hypothetical protein VGO82_07230 [Enterovirga sp.]|jgi:hypothetical protein|nr:hypothetical protein [Enterovirga sp.]